MKLTRLALLAILGGALFAQAPVTGQTGSFVASRKGAKKEAVQKKGVAQLEMLQRMSPSEREKFLNSLPAERKQRLQQRLDLYEKQGDRLSRVLRDFESLPSDQQQTVRLLWMRFNRMPAGRRVLLRREVQSLSNISEDDRRVRVGSDDFKGRFNAEEQRFLLELSQALRVQ